MAGQFETGFDAATALLIGADYDRFENSLFIQRFRPGGIPGGTDISTLDPAAYLLLGCFQPCIWSVSTIPVPGPNTDREEDLDGFGVYIQDQIDLTDQLQLRLGLRWDDFEQDLNKPSGRLLPQPRGHQMIVSHPSLVWSTGSMMA